MTAASKARNPRERKPLTAKRLRELVHYDPDTGIMTWVGRCQGRRVHGPVGTANSHGNLICRIDYAIYYVHRLAFLYMTGRWPTALIDHANMSPADNRWANLREATYAQNAHNRGKSRRSTSGEKDVHWFKPEGVWRVIIKANGKDHFIGRFTEKQAAVAARDEAIKRLHGEFARVA